MAATIEVNEKATPVVLGQFIDQNGVGLALADFDVLMLSIYLKEDPTTFIRSSDPVASDPQISIDAEGNLTWNLRSFETQILPEENAELQEKVTHIAHFEFAWQSPRTGTIENPIATTLDSTTARITLPAHSLEERDSIYLLPSADVGGLDFGGNYIVRSVIDADTFEIWHQKTATATDSGGGSTVWFANGQADSADINMKIRKVDPV